MSVRNLQPLVALVIVLGLVLSCAPGPGAEQKKAPPAATAPGAAPKPAATAAPAATARPGALAVPGAGEKPVSGGNFVISIRDDPPTFDAHQEATFSTLLTISSPTYNTLLGWDYSDHNKMVGDLAKKWEISADGLTFTFYLEEGVKWHDGAPFSAEDVKSSLMRQKDPPKGVYSVSKSQYDPVKSVEVVNPTTVKVIMSRPYPSFLLMMTLAVNSIMPKHILDKQLDMKREVVGTGPWKLTKYTRGVGIELEKNPSYFKKGLPYMDKFLQYIIPDWGTRLAAFRVGRVLTDLRDHEPPTIDTIEQTMKETTNTYRLPGMMASRNPFVVQNKPPFSDVRVRQAVSLALDRWEFPRLCEPGMWTPGGYMVPGGLWNLPDEQVFAQPGYAKPGPAKEAEREKAKKLLAEAGYPNGFEFELQARNAQEYICEGTWLKAQLEKIGLRSNIKTLEVATYFENLRTQNFQIMSSGYGYTVDDPDLIFSEAYSKEGGKNWGKYYNADFEKLVAEQSVTVDPGKRKEIVNKIQLMLHDTVPFPVLGWRNRTVGVWKKVKGFVPWTSERLSSNTKHEYTWLDPNLPPK
ncbi:MAG: ABC transporter substrate-binding protein [Chloroflexi bacterium]|nr:ABC transporter substrate-binding protein [Chloroflexota bacterium]